MTGDRAVWSVALLIAGAMLWGCAEDVRPRSCVKGMVMLDAGTHYEYVWPGTPCEVKK